MPATRMWAGRWWRAAKTAKEHSRMRQGWLWLVPFDDDDALMEMQTHACFVGLREINMGRK